ncbi:MAG: tetratricopeptide repeat protein [Hamadaea sp.]|uniref:hypothetical protein n=1 Tax=Hamadaea sp. TaxID=2024425 RepID=UPI0018039995|nr:hypothetical protein [Hamadaea sp.]NUT20937.1 tetratricopeptide repeat protein [Hamadaea sp.]
MNDVATQAYEAWESEDWLVAGRLLEQAVAQERDPQQIAILWFDAALAYKFARDWPKAYQLGKTAASLVTRGQQEPAFWNLGIAATVLRDWATARDAWTGYGLTLPDGEGEISGRFGMTCVRIQTAEGQEVVWAQRLCPTRARITNVPFHPSRRYGEIVLHDGAPNGERVFDGHAYPVFDEIMLFEPSPTPTLSVMITSADMADTVALADLFAEHDFGGEVMSSRVVMCKCCSEGSVTQERTFEAGRQQMLLGAPEDAARRLLDQWKGAEQGRAWSDLHVLEAA